MPRFGIEVEVIVEAESEKEAEKLVEKALSEFESNEIIETEEIIDADDVAPALQQALAKSEVQCLD